MSLTICFSSFFDISLSDLLKTQCVVNFSGFIIRFFSHFLSWKAPVCSLNPSIWSIIFGFCCPCKVLLVVLFLPFYSSYSYSVDSLTQLNSPSFLRSYDSKSFLVRIRLSPARFSRSRSSLNSLIRFRFLIASLLMHLDSSILFRRRFFCKLCFLAVFFFAASARSGDLSVYYSWLGPRSLVRLRYSS